MFKLMRSLLLTGTVLATAGFALPDTTHAQDYWDGYWGWYDNTYRPYTNRYYRGYNRRPYRNFNRGYYNRGYNWDNDYYYRDYGYGRGWRGDYYDRGYYGRGWNRDGGYLQLGPLGIGWD